MSELDLQQQLRDARAEVLRARKSEKEMKARMQEWAAHAASETRRAEQLEQMVRDLQKSAREETKARMPEILQNKESENPGDKFLRAVLEAGLSGKNIFKKGKKK